MSSSTTETASLDELYKLADVFNDAGDKASELTSEYDKILNTAAKSSDSNEKRLSSQLLSKYFKHFLPLHEKVLSVMISMCESNDSLIQSQVAKDLSTLAEFLIASDIESKDFVERVAYILAQLMLVDDQAQLGVIFKSLERMMKFDRTNTIQGLMMVSSDDGAVAVERTLKYLAKHIKSRVDEEELDKKTEEHIITHCKKKLETCSSKEEMSGVISLLGALNQMTTLTGRQELVDKIAAHSIAKDENQVKDDESVLRVLSCCKMAIPYFSKNVHSTKFVSYFGDHLIPLAKDKKEEPPLEGGENDEGEGIKDDIIKTFAEISTYTGELEEADKKISNVLEILKEYMPLPEPESMEEQQQPSLVFSVIENLLFSLHNLGRKHPDFLSSEENSERLSDLRQRLQYVARCLTDFMKPIKEMLREAKPSELKTDKYKTHVLTNRIHQNITSMIKDLFHNPPQYKSTITLSHLQDAVAAEQAPSSLKRPLSSNGTDVGGKRAGSAGGGARKVDRQLYNPPTGKYSVRAGPAPEFAGRGGGARGGWRGRGFGGFRK